MRQQAFSKTVLICITLALTLTGCNPVEWVPYQRDPPVSIRDLLIDSASVPPKWRVYNVNSVPHGSSLDIGEEDMMISFVTSNAERVEGGLDHHIYRFRNSALAAHMFKTMKADPIFFVGAEKGSAQPASWQYRSPVADDWGFACSLEYCNAIARYDEFVSILGVSARTTDMTSVELEEVLKAIDKHMTEQLGKRPVLTPADSSK